MKYLLCFFFFFGLLTNCLAQAEKDTVSSQRDTIVKPRVLTRADSIRKKKADSIALRVTAMTRRQIQSAKLVTSDEKIHAVLRSNSYFNIFGKPRFEVNIKRKEESKDGLFYLLTDLTVKSYKRVFFKSNIKIYSNSAYQISTYQVHQQLL